MLVFFYLDNNEIKKYQFYDNFDIHILEKSDSALYVQY